MLKISPTDSVPKSRNDSEFEIDFSSTLTSMGNIYLYSEHMALSLHNLHLCLRKLTVLLLPILQTTSFLKSSSLYFTKLSQIGYI